VQDSGREPYSKSEKFKSHVLCFSHLLRAYYTQCRLLILLDIVTTTIHIEVRKPGSCYHGMAHPLVMDGEAGPKMCYVVAKMSSKQ